MIDRESIDYGSKTAIEFISAVRGRDGSTPAPHAAGAAVGQDQCSLSSRGGIPDLASPSAQRTVAAGVQLQEGWSVGGGGLPTVNLNGIYCTGPNNCWGVGDGGTIIRWNGMNWSMAPSPTMRNLRDVRCAGANNCWAAGEAGGAGERPLIIQWDGSAWQINNLPLNINRTLNSVFCNAANDCWAVGASAGGAAQRPLILWWNGATWATRNSNLNINVVLNSVFCNAANDCRAVGTAGGGATQRPLILWWNGAVWATQNSSLNINTVLNDIYCNAGNDCWAVGNASGGELILSWDGTAWTRVGPSAAIPDGDLNEVYCSDANDCWAQGSGGLFVHYNGSAWSASASPTVQTIMSGQIIGPRDRPRAVWREIYR